MIVGRFLLATQSCNYSMMGVMASKISWAIMAPLVVGKICLIWARMEGKWVQRKDGEIMWEYGYLAGNLECVGLEEESELTEEKLEWFWWIRLVQVLIEDL